MNTSIANPKNLYFPETDLLETTSRKIYTKRIKGTFRTLKWWSAGLYLLFFLGPYLRWDYHQAILLDIPARKFYFFNLTIYPQDVWILSFILLFFAMLLILVTATVSRAFCGYFCFQTVWSDVFSWIEEKIEGRPRERQKLDAMAWSGNKIALKTTKHSIWLLLSALTGLSFAAWFTDAYQLWYDFFHLQAHVSAWIVLGLFTVGSYLFAGFMREQVCTHLCPYARIQGALSDQQSLIPSYDFFRGEPRNKLKSDYKKSNQYGDCIDCNLCVAVCPTGVDIRAGEQLGCITCGLCIDACDQVMEKINRPTGLIRYDSYAGIHQKQYTPWYKRPLLISTGLILLGCTIGIIAAVGQISPFNTSVSHHRQPEYLKLSDGSIRNRYQLKLQNKTKKQQTYTLKIIGLPPSYHLNQKKLNVAAGKSLTTSINIDVPKTSLKQKLNSIVFRTQDSNQNTQRFQTVFMSPQR